MEINAATIRIEYRIRQEMIDIDDDAAQKNQNDQSSFVLWKKE